jgi:ABC-type dipeptide/oligopeptide/nickel transport system permease component
MTTIPSDQTNLGTSAESRETALTAGWLQTNAFGSKSASIGRHLLGSLAVILGVLTVTFLVTRVFAPNPAVLFLAPAGNGFVSPAAAAAAKAKVEKSLGLDKSLPVQYYRFIDQVVHGNLGTSFQTGRPVTSDLRARLPATAELAVYALLLGVALGVFAGVLSAVRQRGITDHVVRLFTIGGLALPQFWIGLMLLWLFFTVLHLAPGPIGRLPNGVAPPRSITGFYVVDALLQGDWHTARAAAAELALPVITLAVGLAGPICKLVRSSMVEVLASDYVRTATAMGFGRRRIYLRYALKNGLLPVVTVLAGVIAYTFCGSVLVEGIFGWPGVGNYALQSIQTSDFPAIQGFVLYAAVLYVVIYSLLDYTYTRIDPRIRS